MLAVAFAGVRAFASGFTCLVGPVRGLACARAGGCEGAGAGAGGGGGAWVRGVVAGEEEVDGTADEGDDDVVTAAAAAVVVGTRLLGVIVPLWCFTADAAKIACEPARTRPKGEGVLNDTAVSMSSSSSLLS